MERFFFDIHDGRSQTIDTEGHMLQSKSEAQLLAIRELALIIRDELPDGERETFIVSVRDKNRNAIYVATATVMGVPLD